MNKALAIIMLVLLAMSYGMAQNRREVTPVDTDDKKPAGPVLHYYDKHGDALDEPVLFLATLDTVASNTTNSRPVYPRLYAMEFGLNFADGILAIAGQKYGGADLTASLSMWNWLFPTVELGLGGARTKPEDMNFTYKGSPSVYAKIGADYNFLYKSNPDYRLIVGLRAGFSHFSWSVTDITMGDPYWGEVNTLDINGQSTTATYGELLAGLRVKLYKQWSLGWSFRYRFMFSCKDASQSRPWYVPGYGARDNHFGFTLSVSYTLPFKSASEAAPAEEE